MDEEERAFKAIVAERRRLDPCWKTKEREAEEAVRDDNYQRQLERDQAAHQRQLELLDIRQKNALKLNGIAASRAQKKIDAALRRSRRALGGDTAMVPAMLRHQTG